MKRDRWRSGARRSSGADHRSLNSAGGVRIACVSGHSGPAIEEFAVFLAWSYAWFAKSCVGFAWSQENHAMFPLFLPLFFQDHGRFSAGHAMISQDFARSSAGNAWSGVNHGILLRNYVWSGENHGRIAGTFARFCVGFAWSCAIPGRFSCGHARLWENHGRNFARHARVAAGSRILLTGGSTLPVPDPAARTMRKKEWSNLPGRTPWDPGGSRRLSRSDELIANYSFTNRA